MDKARIIKVVGDINEGWTLVCEMTKTTVAATVVLCAILAGGAEEVFAGPGFPSNLKQVAPMRQDSLKVPSINDVPKDVPSPALATSTAESTGISTEDAQMPSSASVGGYDPSGRRDPFTPVLSQLAPGQVDPTLPPLQRVSLTDMNLIAVIWGAYGYTAMVQMPDGNGYTVRKGTRMGPNNGVVSAVTEKGIIVQERFTDVYGRKQEREYVKLLHSKEGLE
jgi:type IV pilus assembly protein PilP